MAVVGLCVNLLGIFAFQHGHSHTHDHHSHTHGASASSNGGGRHGHSHGNSACDAHVHTHRHGHGHDNKECENSAVLNDNIAEGVDEGESVRRNYIMDGERLWDGESG